MKIIYLFILILAFVGASNLQAVDSAVENLLLSGDWDGVYTMLCTDSTINSDPVAMILYNHACSATNRTQIFRVFTADEIINWAQWVGLFKKRDPVNPIVLYLYGDAKLRLKLYDEALAEFSESIKYDDKFALAYCGRGKALSAKNESDLALKDFNSALNCNEEIAELFYLRSREYHKQGKFNNSISDCSKAIQLQPDFSRAFSQRGQSYHRREKYDEAIFDYNDALELNPNLISAYYYRGKAFFETRQNAKAIADYLVFLQQRPNHLDAHIDIASAYQETGNFEQALVHLDQAIRIDRTISYVYQLKSQICEDSGKYLDAIEACRAYVKYAPSSENEQIDQTFLRIENLKRKLDESEL